MEDDIDSENIALASFIFWNRVKAAAVLLVLASTADELSGESKSLFKSSNFKKSEILSSSACIDPEPPASARIPELGWAAEELPLTLPLEALSSSSLFTPEESRPLRWLKELLYFEMGACLGDADVDEEIAFSEAIWLWRREAGIIGGGGIRL